MARPIAACDGWVVVESLRSEVAIVVMVNLVQWMLYQIGNIRQIQSDNIRIAGNGETDIRLPQLRLQTIRG